jgi:hypothetical protein
MSASDGPRHLRPALVLSSTEESCVVADDQGTRSVAFAAPFPRPRSERVLPGHLVATAAVGGSDLVMWRGVVGRRAGR